MNPEKAIEVLNVLTDAPVLKDDQICVDALKLGIEALKRVKAERTGYETFAPDLLPGETEE